MKNKIALRIFAFFLWAFTASMPTFAAAPNCTNLFTLLTTTFTCNKNSRFVNESMECLRTFESKIKKMREQLSAELISPIAHDRDKTKVDKQTRSFSFNSNNQEMSIARLTELIGYGQISHEEVRQYMRHLRVAFTTQGRELNVDDPEVIAYMSADACYGESRGEILAILKKIEQDIEDLEKTRAAAKALLTASNSKEQNLGLRNPSGGLVSALKNLGSGESEHSSSDVTGVKEDLAKRKVVVDLSRANSTKLSPQSGKLPLSKEAKNNASLITSGSYSNSTDSFRTPGLGTTIDPSGTFSSRGALENNQAQKFSDAKNTTTNGNPSPADQSVGSLIWNDSKGSSQEKLELGLGINSDRDSLEKNASSINTDSAEKKTIHNGNTPSSHEANSKHDIPIIQSSRSIASSETNLFLLVSNRYRSTELFRKARILKVPLSEFEPTLKR